MHRKKGVFSLSGYIYSSPPYPSLNPSRPGMSLTVFFGKDGRVRGVKGREGEESQENVPGQGGCWERFAASVICSAV